MSAEPTISDEEIQGCLDILTAIPARAEAVRHVLPEMAELAAEFQRESLRFNSLMFRLQRDTQAQMMWNQNAGEKTAPHLAAVFAHEKQGMNILNQLRDNYASLLNPMVECVNHMHTLIQQMEYRLSHEVEDGAA